MAMFKITKEVFLQEDVRLAITRFFDQMKILRMDHERGGQVLYTCVGCNDEVPDDNTQIDLYIYEVPGIRPFIVGWEKISKP